MLTQLDSSRSGIENPAYETIADHKDEPTSVIPRIDCMKEGLNSEYGVEEAPTTPKIAIQVGRNFSSPLQKILK
jgi:hypothetical protein